MNARTPARTTLPAADPAAAVFARVLIGVDETDAGYEACRQALRLAPAGAELEAAAVAPLAEAVWAGPTAGRVAEDLLRDCHAALEEALRILGQATESKVLSGSPASALIREIERTGATLVAVGSHGRRRAAEIALGGTAGELLHTAPCSVLVAKTPGGRERFPRRIVAGIDGSLESDRALDVAQELATRLGAELRTVTAVGGKDVDLAHVHLRSPLAEEIDRHPVDALVAASRRADLLVVGSRGLHGLRALGSVSERVAHQAACSTLVVRPSADA